LAPQNAKITIEAKKNFLSISDNGPGISDEMKTKIWNKFYRNDTKKEGFGVGLYLVKRIIDIYGWDIQVDNNPDLGAHFTIYF